MKIVKQILLATLLAVSLVACKKDKVSANGIAGTWEGKWGDVGQTPANFIKFSINSNGTLTRLDQQGQTIATGTWSLNGIEFTGTYTHTSDGQTHKMAGLYTDFNGEITGTWGYSPSQADGGTLDLKKQ